MKEYSAMPKTLKHLWLLFAQVLTIIFAICLVLKFFYPQLQFYPNLLGTQKTATIIQANTTSKQNALTSYKFAAQKAMPSVVNIYTKSKIKINQHDPILEFFFNNIPDNQFRDKMYQDNSSLGSGVIVSKEGYILTNNHVVQGADSIEIALNDGRKTNAKIIGTDADSDLAVLKINLDKLPAINFSNTNLDIGDVVLAIGNPFGVGQTTTMGIISALKRSHLGINTFENFIQTDAAINPGNSGGALVDTNGNLVGINTAIFSKSGGNQGIGFAIPIDSAKKIMEELITGGEVVRGWIGIAPKDIDSQLSTALNLSKEGGAFVAAVMNNSPAQKAGMEEGDIITKINSTIIKDTSTLLNTIAQFKPNTKITCYIIRKGSNMQLNIEIGKRPKAIKSIPDEEQELP